jgi:hypothetical protein
MVDRSADRELPAHAPCASGVPGFGRVGGRLCLAPTPGELGFYAAVASDLFVHLGEARFDDENGGEVDSRYPRICRRRGGRSGRGY